MTTLENLDGLGGTPMKKPPLLRVIFILNALLVIAGFTFYFIFKDKPDNEMGIVRIHLLYMALIYLTMFIGVMASILKKNIWTMRICLLITLGFSILLVLAPIGIGVSVISLGLSFTKIVTKYFQSI